VLGLHLVVWTVLPLLVSANLQLDLVEDLALGRRVAARYWKHPPLPWWLADLLYRITGNVGVTCLAAGVTRLLLWRVAARARTGRRAALIAGAHARGAFCTWRQKFAHDQVQLPFWAFTGLLLSRAGARAMRDSFSPAVLAGAYWSKYAVFVLGATLGLFLLIDPLRGAWRTRPYAMAAAFILIAPNACGSSRTISCRCTTWTSRARGNGLVRLWSMPCGSASQVLFLLPAAACWH
jgi:hypothetical protein